MAHFLFLTPNGRLRQPLRGYWQQALAQAILNGGPFLANQKELPIIEQFTYVSGRVHFLGGNGGKWVKAKGKG